MAQLRIGGIVPGRKPRPSPWSITGRPNWNTFQGVGMQTVTTSLRIAASKAGVKTGGGRRHKARLDKSNLCHRCKPVTDPVNVLVQNSFDRARILSFSIDRMARPRIGVGLSNDEIFTRTPTGREYAYLVNILRTLNRNYLARLLKLERARGRRWARIAPKSRAMLHMKPPTPKLKLDTRPVGEELKYATLRQVKHGAKLR